MESQKREKDYRTLKNLDKIGLSEINLCVENKSKEILVMKIIPKEKLNDDDIKNLIINLKSIHDNKKNNPNIVEVKNIKGLKEKKNIYIYLEYCNGGDLKNYIKDKYPLDEFHIQKIINQLINPIEFMYSKNIVQRILKLNNILINFDDYPIKYENNELHSKYEYYDKLLDEKFTVKIADLGYSKADNDNFKKDKERYNALSLGSIAYELLTNCSPFSKNEKDEQCLPKDLKCSIEIISFINGLLQSNQEKRLNWENIKEHPFLKKNKDDFYFIDLEKISGKENNNSIWNLYKSKYLNINIDEIGQKQVENPEFKQKCIEEKEKAIIKIKKEKEQEQLINEENEKQKLFKNKENKEKQLEKEKKQNEEPKIEKKEENLNKINIIKKDEIPKEENQNIINSNLNSIINNNDEEEVFYIDEDKDNFDIGFVDYSIKGFEPDENYLDNKFSRKKKIKNN